VIYWKNSQKLAYGHTQNSNLLQWKDTKFVKSEKEKAHGTRSRGNQVQTCKYSFPVVSHRMCLNPPAIVYYYWGWSGSAQGFYSGLGMEVPLTSMDQNPDSQKKSRYSA